MIPMEYYRVCYTDRERDIEQIARTQAMLAQLDDIRPGLLAHIRAWLDSLAGNRAEADEPSRRERIAS